MRENYDFYNSDIRTDSIFHQDNTSPIFANFRDNIFW
jgi:hypothetical protein